MESNGKRVSIDGDELQYHTGVINFGEPGTKYFNLIRLIFINHTNK
jgi:glucose-6-phosphate isomerase